MRLFTKNVLNPYMYKSTRTLLSYILIFLAGMSLLASCDDPQPKTVMDQIIANGDSNFQDIINHKDQYEVQVLFSPITRVGDSISVVDHYFNFRPDDYFYPASTVKMPVAFLALQKLNEIQQNGISIDHDTKLTITADRPPQSAVVADTTAPSGYASIGHYIDKLFAVSDNDAYNRLYEFVGQDYINGQLRNKQIFTNSRIVHRVGVGGFDHEDNRHYPAFTFWDDASSTWQQAAAHTQGFHLTSVGKTSKGVAYIDQNDSLIQEAFDFSQKNFINIRDLQESLKRLVLPELFPKGLQYDITDKQRDFVLQSMKKLPKDHQYLIPHTETYYDSYVKFFLFGDSKEPIPDHITIRNKVGFAYGYLTDCAYITDSKAGIEYLLTATIHVNENKTYNDGKYEYDDIGIPFLAQLGRLVHQHMIDR